MILLPVPTTVNRTKVPYTALGRARQNASDDVNICQEVQDMRLRIRTILCCTAIFSAVSFFTITFAETAPFNKAQVGDRIRKVENGVADFEKYLTSRGEKAKDQAG